MMANIGMMPAMMDAQLAVPPPQSPGKVNSGTANSKDGFSGALKSALNSGKSDEPAKQLSNAKDADTADKACETDNTGANQQAACAASVQPQQNITVTSGQQGSNQGQNVDNVVASAQYSRQTSALSAGVVQMAQLNLQTAAPAKAQQSEQTPALDVKSALEQNAAVKVNMPQPALADSIEAIGVSNSTGTTPVIMPQTSQGILPGSGASREATQSVYTATEVTPATDQPASSAVKTLSLPLVTATQPEIKTPDQTLNELNSLLGVKTEVVKAADAQIAGSPAMPNAAVNPAITAATVKTPAVQNMQPSQSGQSSQDQPGDGKNVETAASVQQTQTTLSAKQQGHDSATDNPTMLTGEQLDGNSTLKQDETFSNERAFAATLSQHIFKNDASPAVSDTSNIKANDPYNIAGQIVDQAKLITTPQNSEMIIRLKPEHLGELTLKIVVDNGTVSASFHSSNPEVRGIIENSLGQLRQEIANQGLKVNYVGVYASLDHFSAKDQRGNQQWQMAKAKTKAGSRDFVEAVESVGANYLSKAASGVDYRI